MINLRICLSFTGSNFIGRITLCFKANSHKNVLIRFAGDICYNVNRKMSDFRIMAAQRSTIKHLQQKASKTCVSVLISVAE